MDLFEKTADNSRPERSPVFQFKSRNLKQFCEMDLDDLNRIEPRLLSEDYNVMNVNVLWLFILYNDLKSYNDLERPVSADLGHSVFNRKRISSFSINLQN